MSISSLSFPNNLSRTHPPATRHIVEVKLCFFNMSIIIEKHCFSFSVKVNSGVILLEVLRSYEINLLDSND